MSTHRFWDRVDVGEPDECWPWTGWTYPSGYGRIKDEGKQVLAHRWSYEHAVGPIAAGLVIDHTCHNAAAAAGECDGGDSCPHRRCVNPAHLKMVTHAENLAASPVAPSTVNQAKTHCVNGHEFTPENTRKRSDGRGHRICRSCRAALDARRYASSRSKTLTPDGAK